jgi:ABC-type enterochelin transport system ATPase subunit
MIKVKEVSKNFEDFVALDNITCNISDGCIYGMYRVIAVVYNTCTSNACGRVSCNT